MSPNRDSQAKVTLEDLLRLKRCERPPAEFWARFERELRQKQLAALVVRQSWWQRRPRVLRGMARLHLPLGATAVLALTLFTLHYYEPVDPHVAMSDRGDEALAPASVELANPVAARDSDRAVASGHALASAAEASSAQVAEADSSAAVPAPTAAASSAGSRPWLDGAAGEVRQPLTPSARYIAANLAAAEAAEPELVSATLGPTRGFQARVIPVRTEVMNNLTAPVPGRAMRNNRLASYQGADSGYLPDPALSTSGRERLSRYLSDTALNESISRLGLRGDSLSFKF